MKLINPEDGMPTQMIFKEIIKCTCLVLLSTFIFAQVSTFSIKLSGFTANIFENNNISLSDDMENLFIDYSDDYKKQDNFNNEDIKKSIEDNSFGSEEKYNEIYNSKTTGDKEFKYSINWILSILVGGFFLYSLFFSGMMLARRQIEFLFLFIISPIVFATSIGNKQRRGAVIEQLVSLAVQASVVMLIITLTALAMQTITINTFFEDPVKDTVLKALLFIGCGSFLLTGSQVVNRFIGANVSANSGREQMMALMGFGQTVGAGASIGKEAVGGAVAFGLGAAASSIGASGKFGTNAMRYAGAGISKAGAKLGSDSMANFGKSMETFANRRKNIKNASGQTVGGPTQTAGRFGNRMMRKGYNSFRSAVSQANPFGYGRYRR